MIRFESVTKSYKKQLVLDGLSFTVNPQELVVLIGSSGCGKTTILKMINALIKPTSGDIYVQGESIKGKDPIALRRNMGYVIQQTGLFPHMTVRENIEIVAKLEKRKPKEIANRTRDLMEMVGLDGEFFLDRYPKQLSGGQQQRIGVARAFSLDPDIILMDEPFSALDPVTKSQLQDELVAIQEETRKTIVFVTHDMEEAVRLASRICIIEKGEIVQYDTPEHILKNPANSYVNEFVGEDRIWSTPELIRVADIMITKVVTGARNMTITQALQRMYRLNVNSLVIVDRHQEVQGMLSLKNAARLEDQNQLVGNIMEKDFAHATPEQSLLDVLPMASVNDIHSIPVINKHNILVGLITQSSLMMALSEPYVEEISIDFSKNKNVNGVSVHD